MSLFKSKEWWTSGSVLPPEISDLIHNGSIKLSQLGAGGDGDFIIFGNPNGLLQIYRPYNSYQPTHAILETLMQFPIIQVESGKFVFGSDKEYIAVLYPNSLVVYSLFINEGQTEFGNQSILTESYHHDFFEYAFSMTVGSFGGVKDKDFICIQSLNGVLMFFEQDVATFTCMLPDFMIPGFIAYSQCTDSFIISTSSYTIDSYSYHNLSQLSDKNIGIVGNSKKISADWIFNIGDTVRAMHKVQTSSTNCSLVITGDHTMYCLSDNGTLKFMKRFDFDIICSHAYLVGWYYDINSRLMTMIVSETSTLLIYDQSTLLWSSQLNFSPLVITRGFFSYLPGTIVAIAENGEVKCLYLGTEPELFIAPPIVETDVDFDKIQEELENIQNIINTQNDVGEIALMNKAAEREIPFTISVSKDFEPNNYEHNIQLGEDDQIMLWKCLVNVKIQPINKGDITVINVEFIVHKPFKCSISNQTFHDISDDMAVQTDVYVAESLPISRNDMSVMLVFTNSLGNVRVLQKTVYIPLSLFALPAKPVKEAKYKATINIDKSQMELLDLFKDFDATSFVEVGGTNNVIAFKSLYFPNEIVTIISAKSTNRYRIQSDRLSLMNVILIEIVNRFRVYFKRKPITRVGEENKILDINIHGGISSDILHYLINMIDKHWRLRQKLFEAEKSLDTLSLQFILIQKRLMVKYREKPPTSCDGVHYLLLDTYQMIDVTSKEISKLKLEVLLCGQELCGCVNLINNILTIMDSSCDKIKSIGWALSPDILEHEQQNWEETAAQNITTLLRDKFARNDKEKEKINPFNDIASIKHFDGQKFMKYMQLLLERVLEKYSKTDEGSSSDLPLRRTMSSESQQLNTVEEEITTSVMDNMLEVPQGSLLGYPKKPTRTVVLETEQEHGEFVKK